MTIDAAEPVSPVALVTGGANRIGAALVRHLHERGYRVIVHYNTSGAAAEALCATLNAVRPKSVFAVQADLLSMLEVLQLAQHAQGHWQRLDVLINNASAFYPSPLPDIEEEDWINLMRSNAKAPLFLCRELHKVLRRYRGNIVNIIDSTALQGVAGFTPYTMAKAALANMTRSLARELAPEIRVNGVAPGIILPPEYEGAPDAERISQAAARTPMHRQGTTDDIAHAVLFLIEKASYVTGQIIRVDGGLALAGQ